MTDASERLKNLLENHCFCDPQWPRASSLKNVLVSLHRVSSLGERRQSLHWAVVALRAYGLNMYNFFIIRLNNYSCCYASSSVLCWQISILPLYFQCCVTSVFVLAYMRWHSCVDILVLFHLDLTYLRRFTCAELFMLIDPSRLTCDDFIEMTQANVGRIYWRTIASVICNYHAQPLWKMFWSHFTGCNL